MSAPVLVHITGIAAGGAGVGHLPDGRVVFVHRTAPGEDAEIRVVEEKKRWARGELRNIMLPSRARREAPCPHYARCGGCTLEHLEYAAQLEAKRAIVVESLRRIGGVEIAAPDIVASPEEFRYRNRVSFTLVRLGAGKVIAGFHELNHPARIVDIGAACLLPELPIAQVWERLRASWGDDARLLPSGERLRLTLRGSASGDVAVIIDGGYSGGDAAALIERVHGLSAVWHKPASGGANRLLAGAGAVAEDWQDEELALSGTMFLQVNRAAAALLEDHVLALAGKVAGKRVIDAYCGVGLHARRFARAGASVVGIELDTEAVEEARRSVPSGVEIIHGSVEAMLGRALPADLVVLNPPRNGLDAAVPDILLRSTPARLIYVSCNPATLARDVQRLAGSYRAMSTRCFDLFPQTAHVETVLELECATT